MSKYKCICNEEFEDFKSYTKHAKDCKIYQKKQNREARVKIEKELKNLSENE